MSSSKKKKNRRNRRARANRRRSLTAGRAAPVPGRLDQSVELSPEPDGDRDLDQYFARLDEWIRGESPTLEAHLMQRGFTFPAPDKMSDSKLHDKLWKLIEALAELGVYLNSTDHMSDRELYDRLWNEELREPALVSPDDPNGGYHIDFVGSGSEEDIELYLKHYADDASRKHWQADFADASIPEHIDPPYDRDRHLPQHHVEARSKRCR
ncbi:MAG TPA: hypothetical protein VGL91_22990 [Acidobacteriota bacterium]|jgi:hypothetical protein